MEKKKKNLIEEIEQTLDKKLTVAEMYANRPRKWVLYLAIVLLIVVMVGWSASDIKFTGLMGIVRIIRISTLTAYATGLGIMLNEARNANGIASTAPISVPSTAMAMVCSRRYGTSVSDVPKSRAVSGLKTPCSTPFATSVPVAVRPVK